ncbi:MAG: cytochrome c oxidase subunit 3 family protein [Phycisphaerales bacterium]|nr:MAG: cytochrome c oxidase subunit 3 family protein [Phycisphaerales bacterium]
MTSIDTGGNPPQNNPQPQALSTEPRWKRQPFANHWRSHAEDFDACKIGMWLFLTTEVLLFAGIFVAYAVFRMWYPEAFANGSHHLDVHWGALNTVILLISSFTVAASIRNAQLNQQGLLKINLSITLFCALLFMIIKFTFEYAPKWAEGKRPGVWFSYPFAADPNEHIWWSLYYSATGIHALHVLIGAAVLFVILLKSFKGWYGPKHYTGIEVAGLYWHLVDVIWIFLFPLLYLIH